MLEGKESKWTVANTALPKRPADGLRYGEERELAKQRSHSK